MAKTKQKFGHAGIGSTGVPSSSNYHIYRILGGNNLALTGSNGIRKIVDTIDATSFTPPEFISDLEPISLNGLGYGQNLETGEIVYIVNDERSTVTHDLLSKHMVLVQKLKYIVKCANNEIISVYVPIAAL
jgi:hypothetical protein